MEQLSIPNLGASSAQPNILDKAMCLSITFGVPGISRRIDPNDVSIKALHLPDQEANKNYLHLTKRLFESEAYKKACAVQGKVKNFLRKKNRSLNFPMKSGVWLIPSAYLEEVDNKIIEFQEEFKTLAHAFSSEDYFNAKERAKTELGPFFDESEYCSSVEEVEGLFIFQKQYLSFGTPENLKEVSPTIWQREIDNMKESIFMATSSIQNDIRGRMAELITHAFDKLSPDVEGKRKKFKDASLNNLKQFIVEFPNINITNDAELTDLVDKADKLIDGVSPEFLRADDTLRDKICQSFEGLKNELDGMIEISSSRKFKKID